LLLAHKKYVFKDFVLNFSLLSGEIKIFEKLWLSFSSFDAYTHENKIRNTFFLKKGTSS